MALHIDVENQIEQMQILDLDAMSFVEIDVQEFDEKYRIHHKDTVEPFWKKYLSKNEADIQRVIEI